jgi:Arc-like DNA binding domain
MAKKVRSKRVGRGSDQFMLRLPDGMRAHLADMAARQGRSMNAVIVTSLAVYIAHDGEVDQRTIKNELAEMKQEIKHLRDTLGWRDYELPATQLKRKRGEDPPA